MSTRPGKLIFNMMSNESLFVQINEFGIIISPDAITADLKTALHDSYEVLVYQILCEKPILCVCTSSTRSRKAPKYPTLYPGTVLVPEDCWDNFEVENHAILMNEVFILACLGKPSFEVTFRDLLTVFEILTDTKKLTNFGDEHGLIIGGVEWDHS